MAPQRVAILNAPMVIALMAFAVMAFLFLIDTAINPDGSSPNANVVVNRSANNSVNTNQTESVTEGTFLTNTDTANTNDIRAE